ncbi:MAG TPA: protein kinase [Methylomirabilota bacterium]|nr:protein kinase [Methylomirabilota bacterium]
MAMMISRKYEVLGQLGQGGMGVVYKVRHTALDSAFALKVLPRDLMENPDMVARFYREARMVARLNHPNIVRVSDIDHDAELNYHYFVMEYVQGQTLAQYLRERGPLPLVDVVNIARQVASALAYAHGYTPPVIHRDIKPANIMIEDRTGRVVVMDFGIAKELDSNDTTKSGMVIGTLKYCAPEQMRHEPLDGRADIYSLGMVIYEAYAGRQFFAGLDETSVIGKVLYDVQEHEPVFPRPAPQAFLTLVTRMIAKSRDSRYRTIEEVVHDLDACDGNADATERIVAPPPTTRLSSVEKTRDEVKELEEQIRKLEEERQKRLVFAAQVRAQEARDRATQAGAGQWALDLFQHALSQEEEGRARLRDQQYARAQDAYQEAERLFMQASEQASAAALLCTAEQARREMEAVKAEADRYGARDKARTFYGRGLALQARADDLWEQQTYQEAAQTYAEAQSIFADARDLAYRETFLEEAMAAQTEARIAREAAMREGADAAAGELFQQAARSEQQAATALQNDEFFQARELYAAARQQYVVAQQQAHAERQRQHAQAAQQRLQEQTAKAWAQQTDEALQTRSSVSVAPTQPASSVSLAVVALPLNEVSQPAQEKEGDDGAIQRLTRRPMPASFLLPLLLGIGVATLVGSVYFFKHSRPPAPPLAVVSRVAPAGEPAPPPLQAPVQAATPPLEEAGAPSAAPTPAASTETAVASVPEQSSGDKGAFTDIIRITKYTDAPSAHMHVSVTNAVRAFLDEQPAPLSSEGGVRLALADLPPGESTHMLRLVGGSPERMQEIPIIVHYYPNWEVRRFTDDSRDEAYAVAFAPDGRRIVSTSRDKVLKLWDVESGQKLRTFIGHTDWVTGAAFSPDGQTILSCSDDKTVRLWEVETGKRLRTFLGHSDLVNSVAFSPDGKIAVSGSKDNTLKLWNVQTGKEIQTLTGHRGWVLAVAFAPDGKSVASGSDDRTIRLWDAKTGQLVRTFSGHREAVFSVAFTPDGQNIVSGSHDNTVRLWDGKTGQTMRIFSGHEDWVNGVAVSPDGQWIASGGKDKTVRLWDASTGQLVRTFTGHESTIASVAFSPDGKTVISGSRDKTVRLWWAASDPPPEVTEAPAALAPGAS